MLDFLAKYGCSVPSNRLQRSLPFVWVFGRSFWAVSVYGANVYVENIMVGLEQPSMESVTTGKFVLFLEEDKDLNKHLAIHVELLPGLTRRKELSDQVAQCVLQELLRLNSEYAYYVPSDRQLPKIYLHTFQAQEYFPIGVKHKYIFWIQIWAEAAYTVNLHIQKMITWPDYQHGSYAWCPWSLIWRTVELLLSKKKLCSDQSSVRFTWVECALWKQWGW